MTGADLGAHRKGHGLTQAELAEAAGVSRHAVDRLESQPHLNQWGWALGQLMDVLRIEVVPHKQPNTRRHARGRGDGVLLQDAPNLVQRLEREIARLVAREAAERARERVPCEAKTRKGLPCRNMSEPGRRRRKFHGGYSTGPRIAEGRTRIAEAQRRRWAAGRAGRGQEQGQDP